ncbi:HK97 family phage prohead protease [Glaciecola sp. 2405UD65-10]|uniref:HK97 family phage prohead protease n=1 Tax=Glaciecola sp. 2405UD65-10 TaxID=3397244 RepID=UPI003B592944
MSEYEKRFFQCEVRAQNEEETTKITGFGSVFNKRSENLGGFREIIAPGAFDNVLEDDVRAFFNHDHNFILGRTTSGTLRLSVNEEGLAYEIDAPQTQTIRDLVLAPMGRGDVNQSSFAFRVAQNGEEWEEDDEGVIVRTITKMQRLFDVSPVSMPAYPDAGSAVRSLNAWKEARESGAIKKAVNNKAARERFLELIKN